MDCAQQDEPLKPLAIKLDDLSIKYESLEHQFNLAQLENNHYREHIAVMIDENETLQRTLYLTPENSILPCVLSEIHSNVSKLTENEKEIEALNEKLRESTNAIKALQTNQVQLESQNNQLRTKLESTHSQKQFLKQKYDKETDTLHRRIQVLHEELDMVQLQSSNSSQPCEYTTNDLSDSLSLGSDNEEPHTLSLGFGPRTIDFTSGEYIIDKAYLSDIDDDDECEHDSNTFFDAIVDKLESENAELLKQLKKISGNGKTHQHNNTEVFSWDDEEPNVMDIFDEDEMIEMEELFKKCDAEIKHNKMVRHKAKSKKSARWQKHMLLLSAYKY